MPIVDLAIVVAHEAPLPSEIAQALADACAAALNTPAGRLWLRLQRIPSDHYAENGFKLNSEELPVFVTVLHASLPAGPALKSEMAALTTAVAHVTGRPRDRVHIEYAPPGRGRLSFGGQLVE